MGEQGEENCWVKEEEGADEAWVSAVDEEKLGGVDEYQEELGLKNIK